jgi:hypothetical protein
VALQRSFRRLRSGAAAARTSRNISYTKSGREQEAKGFVMAGDETTWEGGAAFYAQACENVAGGEGGGGGGGVSGSGPLRGPWSFSECVFVLVFSRYLSLHLSSTVAMRILSLR